MRAKSHDQRKGQWLINNIRFANDFPILEKQEKESFEEYIIRSKFQVEFSIWNLENDEFDKLMKDYDT